MGRKVHFGEQEVTLFLTGLHPFLAFKHKISMLYGNIESVYVDYFDAPKWMLRMPGTSFHPFIYMKAAINMRMNGIFFRMNEESLLSSLN